MSLKDEILEQIDHHEIHHNTAKKGLVEYKNWAKKIDWSTKNRRLKKKPC